MSDDDRIIKLFDRALERLIGKQDCCESCGNTLTGSELVDALDGRKICYCCDTDSL